MKRLTNKLSLKQKHTQVLVVNELQLCLVFHQFKHGRLAKGSQPVHCMRTFLRETNEKFNSVFLQSDQIFRHSWENVSKQGYFF